MLTSFSQVRRKASLEEAVDAVVIGSGAGGSAIAAELAEGGRSVLVLEEGGDYTTKDFSLDAPAMIRKLYRNAGTAVIRGTPNILFSEGRCVGGSTVINGGMSWRTPEKILHKWQKDFDLSLSAESLDPVFEKVEKRVHVAAQDPESIGEDSSLLKRGADALSWKTVDAARNQKHCAGSGNCAFGCPTGAKQSAALTYIPHLYSLGGRIFSGCRAEKILTRHGRAEGVTARFFDPETSERGPALTVHAPIVVLAAGAIQTPALLLRNRLANSSRQVGRNFLCHPNAKVVALFDRDVFAWKGTIQGYQVREFADEGILIATTMVPPALLAMGLPYFGDASFEVMRDYNRMVVAGCLVEDTDVGRVSLDVFGEAKMRYDLCDRDARSLKRGVALTAELFFAAGAKKILLPFDHLTSIDSPEDLKKIVAAPIPKDEIECLTVHAMGTCRMGRDPRSSVVNEWGESHDVRGLYIADASVFPGPIGVNPQISIMALATRTGQHILGS